jgi:hypothetical protein
MTEISLEVTSMKMKIIISAGENNNINGGNNVMA